MRLCKLFALRRVIRHSHKTKSKLEQERLKRRAQEKREGSKIKNFKRKQALKMLNDRDAEINYHVKGEAALKIKNMTIKEEQSSKNDATSQQSSNMPQSMALDIDMEGAEEYTNLEGAEDQQNQMTLS